MCVYMQKCMYACDLNWISVHYTHIIQPSYGKNNSLQLGGVVLYRMQNAFICIF